MSLERIETRDASRILERGDWVSAIGHKATAALISGVLRTTVPVNRKTVLLRQGDTGLHFFLKKRLPEGAILGLTSLKKMDYWFAKSEVLSASLPDRNDVEAREARLMSKTRGKSRRAAHTRC